MAILCLLSECRGNEWQVLSRPMPTHTSTAWASKDKQSLNSGNVKEEPGVFICLESQKERTWHLQVAWFYSLPSWDCRRIAWFQLCIPFLWTWLLLSDGFSDIEKNEIKGQQKSCNVISCKQLIRRDTPFQANTNPSLSEYSETLTNKVEEC